MIKSIPSVARFLAFIVVNCSVAYTMYDYHQKNSMGLCFENMKESETFSGVSINHIITLISDNNLYHSVRLRSSFMSKTINEFMNTEIVRDKDKQKSFNSVQSFGKTLTININGMINNSLCDKPQRIHKFDIGWYASFGRYSASKHSSLGVFVGMNFSNVFTVMFPGFNDLKLKGFYSGQDYNDPIPRSKRYENIYQSAPGAKIDFTDKDKGSSVSGDPLKVVVNTAFVPDFSLMLLKILYRSSVVGVEYTSILKLNNRGYVSTSIRIGTNLRMQEDIYYGIANSSASGKYPNARYAGVYPPGILPVMPGITREPAEGISASAMLVTPYIVESIVSKASVPASSSVHVTPINIPSSISSKDITNYFDSEEGNVSDLINRLSRIHFVNSKVCAAFLDIDVFVGLVELHRGLTFGCYASAYIQKSLARIYEDDELMQDKEMQSRVFKGGIINAFSSNYIFEYAAVDGLLSDFSRVCFGVSLIYAIY